MLALSLKQKRGIKHWEYIRQASSISVQDKVLIIITLSVIFHKVFDCEMKIKKTGKEKHKLFGMGTIATKPKLRKRPLKP